MANPYAPPLLDFSPLGKLGETFFNARDKARKRADEEAGYAAFDRMLQGQPMRAPAAQSGGVPLAALGQAFAPATGTPRTNIDRNTVHVAETEEDVQRLERATGQHLWDEDKDAIVRTVYGEASGEGPVGQAAVAGVIANRARQSGMTPKDVVLAKGQFEPWSDPAARARMQNLDPNSPTYQQVAPNSLPVVQGQAPDPTGGADHFYSPGAQAALGRNAPSWDDGTGRDIGNHRFFQHGYGPQRPVQVAQADIPAPGARNAQGFAIPGQAAGLPAAPSQARALFSPEEAMQLRAMYRSETTRPLALAIVQQRMGSKTPYSFTTVNGQLVRTRSDTGEVELVSGVGGQGKWSRLNDGTLYNEVTGQTLSATGGQPLYRSLVDPAERAHYGIPESDTRPYQVGPDGKLTAPPGGVNVDMRAETAEAGEIGKEAGKATAEMYKAASSAGTQIQTLNRLKNLLSQVDTGKLTPARMSIAAWGKAAGIPEEMLKQAGLNPAEAGTAQAITAIVNSMVVQQIGAGGFPANNFSDADRVFLTDIMVKLSNVPRGNSLIIEAMKRTNELKIEKAKEFRRWKAQNRGGSYFDFETDWAQQMQSRDVFGDLAQQAEGLGITSGGAQPGAPVTVRNADDYNRLPSGSTYVDPQGNVRTKR